MFSTRPNLKAMIGDVVGRSHPARNLLNPMPWIVTSFSPLPAGAWVNTRAELDRAFRTIVKEHGYQGRRLVFLSCLNIGIFPLRICVPRVASCRTKRETIKPWNRRKLSRASMNRARTIRTR
jgi:hypothetical protein